MQKTSQPVFLDKIFCAEQNEHMKPAGKPLSDGYSTVRGSDVQRNGRYLELIEEATEDEVAEVFCSNATHKMTISVFQSDMSVSILELLIERAKYELSEP